MHTWFDAQLDQKILNGTYSQAHISYACKAKIVSSFKAQEFCAYFSEITYYNTRLKVIGLEGKKIFR